MMVTTDLTPGARDAAIANLRSLFQRLPMIDELKADLYARQLEAGAFELATSKSDWECVLREKEYAVRGKIERAMRQLEQEGAGGVPSTTCYFPNASLAAEQPAHLSAAIAGEGHGQQEYCALSVPPWGAVFPHMMDVAVPGVPHRASQLRPVDRQNRTDPLQVDELHAPGRNYNIDHCGTWSEGQIQQQVHPYVLKPSSTQIPVIQQGLGCTQLVAAPGQPPQQMITPSPQYYYNYHNNQLLDPMEQQSAMMAAGHMSPPASVQGNPGPGGQSLSQFRTLQTWAREKLLVDAKRVVNAYNAQTEDGKQRKKSQKHIDILTKAISLVEVENIPAGLRIDDGLVTNFRKILGMVAQAVKQLRRLESRKNQVEGATVVAPGALGRNPTSSQTQVIPGDHPVPFKEECGGNTEIHVTRTEQTASLPPSSPLAVTHTSGTDHLNTVLGKRSPKALYCGTDLLNILEQRQKTSRADFPLPTHLCNVDF